MINLIYWNQTSCILISGNSKILAELCFQIKTLFYWACTNFSHVMGFTITLKGHGSDRRSTFPHGITRQNVPHQDLLNSINILDLSGLPLKLKPSQHQRLVIMQSLNCSLYKGANSFNNSSTNEETWLVSSIHWTSAANVVFAHEYEPRTEWGQHVQIGYSFFWSLGTALPASHCVMRTAVSSTFRASALNSGFRARLSSRAHSAEYWM